MPRHAQNLALLLMAGLLAFSLGACATLPGGPVAGQLPSGPQVAQSLEARRLAVRSFAMEGEIMGRNRQGELNGEQRLWGSFPDRLRAEIMGPFGKPAMLLICDGVRLAVLSYGENKAYLGSASKANVARFLGMALSPAEVFSLLAGSMPLVSQGPGQVSASSERGLAVLSLRDPQGVEEGLIFGLGDYAVHQAWIRESRGQAGLSVVYERFQTLPEGSFPTRVKLEDQEGRTLTLDNDKLGINQPLDQKLFEPVLPPGVEVQELP